MASAAYAEPRPTINLSIKFGVPLEPSQRAQFDGTPASVPDHIIIPPIGIVPFPTKSVAVTVPPAVMSSAALMSSVDVICSAVTVALAVRSPVIVVVPVTLIALENVETPATSRVSKA